MNRGDKKVNSWLETFYKDPLNLHPIHDRLMSNVLCISEIRFKNMKHE